MGQGLAGCKVDRVGEGSRPVNSETTDKLVDALSDIIVGKEHALRLCLTALLARGHLLIEDVPGVGKTTLAHALAKLLGLEYRRIQFTSDLLPADILGNSIFDREQSRFVFHPGPLFGQLILVDEINRATPKTQSALLEAMEEFQISVDGVTYPLPNPFFVVATQNPIQQIGTFPIPESQLDRFLMKIELGYPDRSHERVMLQGRDRRELIQTMTPLFSDENLLALQKAAAEVRVSDALLDYLQDLLDASRREHPVGLSPRAGLALLKAGRAWALMHGREIVLPEDLQEVGPPVMAHRLEGHPDNGSLNGRELADELLRKVPVP